MNASNRLLVNLRLILPGWVIFGVAAVAGLPAVGELLHVSPVLSLAAAMFSFWAGVLVTSAQAWNAEMVFGTLPALLLQPVARRQLWKEKAIATGLAVAPLMALHVAGSAGLSNRPTAYLPFAMVWAGIVVLSTMPGLFLAKSSFTLVLHVAVVFGVPFLMVIARGVDPLTVTRTTRTSGELLLLTVLGFVALIAHALSALNRVRHTLSFAEMPLRPQVDTGFVPVWDKVERKLDRLRPVRTTPVLNFVWKELRLLWLFWGFTLSISVVMIVLIPFRMMEWSRRSEWLEAVTGVLVFLVVFFAAWLPGTGFAGERASGLHTLHMTLPISSRRIWRLRALTSSLSVFIAVAWILVLTGVFLGQHVDNDFEHLFGPRLVGLPLAASLLALLSLCCSTVGGGKEEGVGAAVGIPFFMLGVWFVGKTLIEFGRIGFWFDGLLDVVHPYPFADATRELLMFPAAGNLLAVVLLLLFLAGALVRSYRTFSLEPLAGLKAMVPYALVAVGFAFVSGVSQAAPRAMWTTNQHSATGVIGEVISRLTMLNIDSGKISAAQPFTLSIEDLEKAAPLSSGSRRWLTSPAAILKVPRNGRINGFTIQYDMQLNLKGGWTCTSAIVGALHFDESCKLALQAP